MNKEILAKLTLEEKAQLLDGLDFWHLKDLAKADLPSIMVCDGPHGLRKKDENSRKSSMGNSVKAVCFPTACTTACSWDTALLAEMGEALGKECKKENVAVLLGPGINMKRSPLCGRNFEYFSEDPLLAGELAAAFIGGVQSTGTGTSLKHFAANSQETRRMSIDEVVDERALREIYLPAFEIAVKKAQPWTVMCAYNKLNGTHCSEHKWLLDDVLRKEWGFQGLVVSDWGAVNNRPMGVAAGQDLEMPSSFGLNCKKILEAVQNGTLSEEAVDAAADRVITLIQKHVEGKKIQTTFDPEAQHALARKVAEQSIVLLKNEGNLLPLAKKTRIAVIGDMAKTPRYQGAGSSLINPTKVENALDALKQSGLTVVDFAPGYARNSVKPDVKLINQAVEAAKNAEVAVIFAGLTEAFDSEGFDKTDIRLPESQNALIRAVVRANPNTVVVLAAGSPVSMPWLPDTKALLNSYLSGQAGASAIANILTGAVNPSGKLAESYPFCNEDSPTVNQFPGNPASVEHRESIYIGYRYYEKVGKALCFPFGHGLSYTTFAYSNLRVGKKSIKDSETLKVSFKVQNTGDVAGAEIVQLYVGDDESTAYRPKKELKGFQKVFLAPGESTTVHFALDKRAFAYYNTALQDWHVESGTFTIYAAASSADVRQQVTVQVESTAPKAEIPDYRQSAPVYYTGDPAQATAADFEAVLGHPLPPTHRAADAKIGMSNSLEDAANTKWGSRVNKTIDFVFGLMPEGANTGMMHAVAKQTPLRCMQSMSGGLLNDEISSGIVTILNDGKGGIKKIAKSVPGVIKNIDKVLKMI